jgi:hypothetical protein
LVERKIQKGKIDKMKKIIKDDDVYNLYGKLLVKESKENKALLEIEQIIKDHDEDDDWYLDWYIDKIREVIRKWKKNI